VLPRFVGIRCNADASTLSAPRTLTPDSSPTVLSYASPSRSRCQGLGVAECQTQRRLQYASHPHPYTTAAPLWSRETAHLQSPLEATKRSTRRVSTLVSCRMCLLVRPLSGRVYSPSVFTPCNRVCEPCVGLMTDA
jgi:hypothetical protein